VIAAGFAVKDEITGFVAAAGVVTDTEAEAADVLPAASKAATV